MTLLGTSDSNGMPLTLNLPFDKSKWLTEFSDPITLKVELTGLFGGAMRTEENRGTTKLKQTCMKDFGSQNFENLMEIKHPRKEISEVYVSKLELVSKIYEL